MNKVILEIRGGDLICRDGYNVKLFDRNSSKDYDNIILEIQTKDIEEFFMIFRTLDSLLKTLEEKQIEFYDCSTSTKIEEEK